MAAALPVALRRDQAVEGALVVVGGGERVADFPQRYRRTQDFPSEAGNLRVRAARAARKIGERNFDHAESVGVGFDQHFLLHLEVGRGQFELLQRLAPVQAISAGDVAHRHREHPPQHQVQQPTRRTPHEVGVGDAAKRVARRDHDVGTGPRPPHLHDEVGIVRLVGVEGKYVVAPRLGNPRLHRARVSAPAFRNDSRAERSSRFTGAVGGRAVDHHDLVREPLAVEQRAEPGDQGPQVLGLVHHRQNYGNVHSGSVSFMLKREKRKYSRLPKTAGRRSRAVAP